MSQGNHPILYSFRRCPYAMRARMALRVASIDCELREVVLRNKPAQMTALSPKGTVPVLQLTEGKVIDESLDVMYWALAQTDPGAWLMADAAKTQALVTMNDGPFKQQLDRYKYAVRFPEYPQAHYRSEGEVFLRVFDDALNEHDGAGLCCERKTLADYALFPFVRQFSKVDLDWFSSAPFACLQRWLSDIEEGALFQSVMKKYPVWSEGAPITLFAANT